MLPFEIDPTSKVELQCGHSPKAVENGVQGFALSRPQVRFNAATARRPWRTEP